jgi:hypothetical protein
MTEPLFRLNQWGSMAAERLTSSPRIMNIYGYCGHSELNEVALGVGFDLLEVTDPGSLERLYLGLELARALRDVHSIDYPNSTNVTLSHSDLHLDNIVAVPRMTMRTTDKNNKYVEEDARLQIKLNDFNRAVPLRWSKTATRTRVQTSFRGVVEEDRTNTTGWSTMLVADNSATNTTTTTTKTTSERRKSYYNGTATPPSILEDSKIHNDSDNHNHNDSDTAEDQRNGPQCGYPSLKGHYGWRGRETLPEFDYVDPAKADVFAMGSVLYCLLTSSEPFQDLEPNGPLEREVVLSPKHAGHLIPFIPDIFVESNNTVEMILYEAAMACYRERPKDRPTSHELAMALETGMKWAQQ